MQNPELAQPGRQGRHVRRAALMLDRGADGFRVDAVGCLAKDPGCATTRPIRTTSRATRLRAQPLVNSANGADIMDSSPGSAASSMRIRASTWLTARSTSRSARSPPITAPPRRPAAADQFQLAVDALEAGGRARHDRGLRGRIAAGASPTGSSGTNTSRASPPASACAGAPRHDADLDLARHADPLLRRRTRPAGHRHSARKDTRSFGLNMQGIGTGARSAAFARSPGTRRPRAASRPAIPGGDGTNGPGSSVAAQRRIEARCSR